MIKISLNTTWNSYFTQSNLLTLVMLNKLRFLAHFYFSVIRLLDPECCYKFTYLMAKTADPDQLASSEAKMAKNADSDQLTSEAN